MNPLLRPSGDKPLPPVAAQAWHAALALGRVAKAKMLGRELLVPPETALARLEVCGGCPHRNERRCTLCGCWLDVRPDGGAGMATLATERCPDEPPRWA